MNAKNALIFGLLADAGKQDNVLQINERCHGNRAAWLFTVRTTDQTVQAIYSKMLKTDGILGIADCHVWVNCIMRPPISEH